MTSSAYRFETLNVTEPLEFVYHVEINRPEKRNAMDKTFWRYKYYSYPCCCKFRLLYFWLIFNALSEIM